MLSHNHYNPQTASFLGGVDQFVALLVINCVFCREFSYILDLAPKYFL